MSVWREGDHGVPCLLGNPGLQVPAPLLSVPSRYGSNHGAQTGAMYLTPDTVLVCISTSNLRIFCLVETIVEFRLKPVIELRGIKLKALHTFRSTP